MEFWTAAAHDTELQEHAAALALAEQYREPFIDAVRRGIKSGASSSGTAALFCVERDPEACHRSLIAQRLTEQHHVTIEHLRPLDHE